MIDNISSWMQEHSTLVWWLGGLSILTLVATLVAIPLLVVRIPADYFTHDSRVTTLWADRHPITRMVLLILKNALGVILILAGIVMLVFPGQGLLTILIGILLVNFPGKYQLERWMIRRPTVLSAVNWIRGRNGRPPIKVDG